MKMVKSLLLSSAAGFVAVAGAQAADLPVKAKPVEYVKVCSLYGAGFFYIPGTDTCIKIGGAVRVQAEFNAGNGGIPVGLGDTTEGAQGAGTRTQTNNTNFRTRIYFSVDARQQTEYGTLRTYFRMGIQETTPGSSAVPGYGNNGGSTFFDRAFIQFAGFTVGKTLSFFDGISFATFNYNNPRVMGDTGPGGLTVWAYTAQFGNGISASLSAEDPNGRGKGVMNAAQATWTPGAQTNDNGLAGQTSSNNGFLFPDVVGALRVDQAWGSAQLMGAMHDASGGYYSSLQTSGHPSNAYGWAAGASLAINLPTFGATSNVNSQPNVDQFQVQAAVARGAAAYTSNALSASNGTFQLYGNGQNVGLAWINDGIYSTGTAVELTSTWSVMAGYQHLWTPNWRTSVYGGYLNVSYDSTATGYFCSGSGFASGFTFVSGNVCNPNFHVWQAGTRTQWNPVSQLDVGVDVLYSKLDLGDSGSLVTLPANGARPAGTYTLNDQDVWSVMFRVQRNFWP